MEAAGSFKESARLDSTCAMAYWGIAYVLGPNYNTSANLGEQREIRSAVAKAVRYSESVFGWEKDLIAAIAVKFPDSAAVNTEGYAEAMRKAYSKYPDNDIIATLFAESIMNLHAWICTKKKEALHHHSLQCTREVCAMGKNTSPASTFPKNGFALNGLYHSLNRQGKTDEAATVKAEFEKAWARADSKLEYSTISEKERKNLVIRVVESTPEDLMFIAGSFCNTKN